MNMLIVECACRVCGSGGEYLGGSWKAIDTLEE